MFEYARFYSLGGSIKFEPFRVLDAHGRKVGPLGRGGAVGRGIVDPEAAARHRRRPDVGELGAVVEVSKHGDRPEVRCRLL